MTSPTFLSYEETVQQLRADPSQHALLEASYLDEDVRVAAERFQKSDEWKEILCWLSRWNIHASSHVLDLGCGNGIASLAFAHAGFHVIALDPNAGEHSGLAALEQALKAKNLSLQLKVGTAEHIPLENASIDLVYLRQAAHHFQDLHKSLQECFRVLRPGGYCFMTREHVISDEAQRDEFLQNHPMQKYHGGEWAYQEEEYIESLSKAGFTLRACFGTFESAVNYAPLRREEIHGWLIQGLVRRFGKSLGHILAKSPLLFSFYLRKLQQDCNYPGRMYSFIAQKNL